MRIVFDTNVLARAHQLAHGPARRGLLFVATGSDVLILSQHLLQELRRILAYPRVLKSSGLTGLDISEYLAAELETQLCSRPPQILRSRDFVIG